MECQLRERCLVKVECWLVNALKPPEHTCEPATIDLRESVVLSEKHPFCLHYSGGWEEFQRTGCAECSNLDETTYFCYEGYRIRCVPLPALDRERGPKNCRGCASSAVLYELNEDGYCEDCSNGGN